MNTADMGSDQQPDMHARNLSENITLISTCDSDIVTAGACRVWLEVLRQRLTTARLLFTVLAPWTVLILLCTWVSYHSPNFGSTMTDATRGALSDE